MTMNAGILVRRQSGRTSVRSAAVRTNNGVERGGADPTQEGTTAALRAPEGYLRRSARMTVVIPKMMDRMTV